MFAFALQDKVTARALILSDEGVDQMIEREISMRETGNRYQAPQTYHIYIFLCSYFAILLSRIILAIGSFLFEHIVV